MIVTAWPDLGSFASLNPDHSIANAHDDSRDSPVPFDAEYDISGNLFTVP
jgi:hypothetical protein